jgi:GxxExxY protein
MNYLHQDLTDRIIGCFYEVYNTLGYGFLEKVYERSLMVEILQANLVARNQIPVKVRYKGECVGNYYADIVVNDTVIIEIKALESIAREHELQLVNYLKATDIEVGLLLNFGKKPEIRRKIFTNDRKE